MIARKNTIKTYKSLESNWIKPYLKISGGSLEDAVKYWKSSNLKPKTIRVLLRLLYKNPTFINKTEDEYKSLQRIISRMEQSPELKVLTKDQARKLLDTCDRELYPLFLMALHTGARRGEIFGLKWRDVNFIKNTLTIRRSYDGPTKNGKTRSIPISNELEKCLMNRYNVGGDEDVNIFEKVFDPNPHLKISCKDAGIPEINFHSLRHTFASLALESGTSPKQVQLMLGHSNVSTTLNIYWQSFNETPELTFLP